MTIKISKWQFEKKYLYLYWSLNIQSADVERLGLICYVNFIVNEHFKLYLTPVIVFNLIL